MCARTWWSHPHVYSSSLLGCQAIPLKKSECRLSSYLKNKDLLKHISNDRFLIFFLLIHSVIIFLSEITYLVLNFDDSSISNTFKLYVSPQTDKRFGLLLENSSLVIWFLIGWWTWTFSLVFLMSYKWTWPDWFPTTMLSSLFGNHLTHVGQLEMSLYMPKNVS